MNNSDLQKLLEIDRSTLPPDGGTEFNRLIFSRSPYLLQHARNPVHWREWGDEAFKEAQDRDLPLLVSIGYSTCHWCHVMAHESFEDDEVAGLINSAFIPVKVDREERPDLDDFYMTAARALTGGGGWPLNVFIDHDKRPFFSITYLPKLPRFRTPGFMDLLKNISVLWSEKRELINSNSAELCRTLQRAETRVKSIALNSADAEKNALDSLNQLYDPEYGGFGMAVKFPMPTNLLFLLSRKGEIAAKARQMALHTLDRILQGGIYDQIGGGFHRYSVDRKWHIPHFEKMLYDQALMITALCEAYKVSNTPEYLHKAVTTANFCIRDLQSISGGYCAGMDADSDGEEGLFYTWDKTELMQLLTGRLSLLHDYWDYSEESMLEGRITLIPRHDPAKCAALKGITDDMFTSMLSEASEVLLKERSKREHPLKDLKVVCSWNGLLISAFIRLYEVTSDTSWLIEAENCTAFILTKMIDVSGRLRRTALGEHQGPPAFAEDYALFALALADVIRHDNNSIYKDNLLLLLQEILDEFSEDDGTVVFSAKCMEQMPISLPQVQDNVIPSAAALVSAALIEGWKIHGDVKMRNRSEAILNRYSSYISNNPGACLSLIMAAEKLEPHP